MSKSIYWTLQSNCPQTWKSKFQALNYIIQHFPLIQLRVNKAYSKIPASVDKFDALIVSSQYSAQKVSTILENQKFAFYTVGLQASSILRDAGHEVLHIAKNSEDLAVYLKEKADVKILHLCSENSDVDIWPTHVETLPFYKPIENTDFNLSQNHIDDDSIMVFGSPSGVDVWFTKNIDLSTTTIASMGKTTASRFANYTNQSIIIPEVSTLDHLCQAIYNHLKLPKYE